MGRKKSEFEPPISNEALDSEAVERGALIQNTVATARDLAEDQKGISERVFKRIGRRDALKMVKDFVTAYDILDVQRIKESKEYKGLEIYADGQTVTITTWPDYCAFIEGRSCESVDLDILNLKHFGEELFESMLACGIGPSKMRALRQLPEDAQSALIEAARSDDRETLVELAEDLIARYAKEKADQAKQTENLTAELDAKNHILVDKNNKIDELSASLTKAMRRIRTLTVEEADKELRKEAALVAFEAEVAVAGNLRAVCSTMLEHGEQNGTDCRPFLAGMVRHLEEQLAALRVEFMLPDGVGAEEFGWLGQQLDT